MRFTQYFVLVLPLNILCRDAIQFFIKHRKVQHFTIDILKNKNNSTNTWIEYKYVFDNDENGLERLNRTLKIGVFIDKFDCQLANNNTYLKGHSIDIIETLRESLNIRTEFIIIDNLTLESLDEVDLIICYPRSGIIPSNLTESYPTIRSNLLLVYKPTKLNFTRDIFILTFAGSLWLVFFALLVTLAVCLRISTVKHSMICSKHESWTWVEITLWAIAAACQQGLSHTPSGFASCCIFFLGYLMAYLLYTGFAAAITSILVQNDLKTEYATDLDGLFEGLNKDNRIGVGSEISIRQYMGTNLKNDQISAYSTSKLNLLYTRGFLIPHDNPWRKLINKQILKMDQSGILQNRLRRPPRIFDGNSGYSSAGPEHVGSGILLFLGGVLISLIFLVVELALDCYKRGRNRLGL